MGSSLVCRFLDWALDARGCQEYTTLLTLMNMVVQLSRKYSTGVSPSLTHQISMEIIMIMKLWLARYCFIFILKFEADKLSIQIIMFHFFDYSILIVLFTIPQPHSSHWGWWELLSFLVKWEIFKHGNWVKIWIRINAVKHKKWYDQLTYASNMARIWLFVHSLCNMV